jgi:uncharacterized protein (DUF1697 family)
VVFTSEEADTARIAAALERAIAMRLGVRPRSPARASRTAEAAGTARNWATVNKLLALCDG